MEICAYREYGDALQPLRVEPNHQTAKRARESQPRPFSDDLVRLGLQFLVLTLGGAIVSFAFQYFGKSRDEDAQRAKFEKDSFLTLRGDVDRLITQRIVVTDRIASRLRSGDYIGAMELRKTTYEQALTDWNQNVNRLLRPLKTLAPCGSGKANPEKINNVGMTNVQSRTEDQKATVIDQKNVTEGGERSTSTQAVASSALSQSCLVTIFYDRSDESRYKSGRVTDPKSLHFAFVNASSTLIQLLSSDWASCLEILQSATARAKERCTSQALASGENTSQLVGASGPTFGLAEKCIQEVRAFMEAGLHECEDDPGVELKDLLSKELAYVRNRWEALDGAFSRIESNYR